MNKECGLGSVATSVAAAAAASSLVTMKLEKLVPATVVQSSRPRAATGASWAKGVAVSKNSGLGICAGDHSPL